MTPDQIAGLQRLQRLARAVVEGRSESAAAEAIVAPKQLQMARKLLGWSSDRLGAESGTTAYFIRQYEKFGRAAVQRGGEHSGIEAVRAVRVTLEVAGVAFGNGDKLGIKLAKEDSDV